MTSLAAFIAGLACGWLLAWWPLSRRMARWLGSVDDGPPSDRYLDDLAAIIDKERW